MSKIFPRFFLPLLAAAFIVACIRIPKQPQTTDPDTTPLTYRFDGGADLTALFTLQASYIEMCIRDSFTSGYSRLER